MNTNIQEIKDLSIGFISQKGKQISILRNITTNIRKGETVGIVGESGSGKSTLALAMMGYIKHGLFTTGGECLFKSQNLLSLNNKELEDIRGKKIAMIPQNAGQALTPNLKIGYQIEEALKLHTDYNKNEREQKIMDMFVGMVKETNGVLSYDTPYDLAKDYDSMFLALDMLVTNKMDVSNAGNIRELCKYTN